MRLTLASCCGSEVFSKPGDILAWAIVGLCCGLLLLGLTLYFFLAMRKHSLIPGRRAGVVLPATLAALALLLAQQAWSAYTALRVTEPVTYSDVYTDNYWYARLDSAVHLYGTLGIFLAAGTLLALGVGVGYVLMYQD